MAGKKKTKEVAVATELLSSITLNAILFKDMVARARKVATSSFTTPLSEMMGIELKDNKLTITTTDSVNYLFVTQDKVEGDDFYVTVYAEQFAQFISKMTCDKITLELYTNGLKVVGNGEYTFELPDDEGEIIKFPDPRNDVELEPIGEIKLSTINNIIDTAKASLAVTLEEPCYVNYYCGDKVITTDRDKMCGLDLKLWDAPRLIPQELMNMIALMTAEDIKVSAADDIIMFSTPDCVVYGRSAEGIEDYPAEDVDSLLSKEFPSNCKLKKSDLLQLLDRLSLFVTKTDKDVIYLTFTKDGLQITSKKATGVEVVPYIESTNFNDFTCAIDIKMLQSEVKSLAGDSVYIEYGPISNADGDLVPVAIKFIEGNAIIMVALTEDDRVA